MGVRPPMPGRGRSITAGSFLSHAQPPSSRTGGQGYGERPRTPHTVFLVAISISMAMGVSVIVSVFVLAFRLSESRAESRRVDGEVGEA